MNFQSATPAAVKAIRQRDLLNTWLRLYARKQVLPAIAEYEPSRLAEERSDLVYYAVDYTPSLPVFIILSEGTRMSSAYGQTGKGRRLDEYVGPALADLVLPIYLRCVASRHPVYTIDQLDDVAGHTVEYERLLLPFGADGALTHIVASLKTISIDGQFEIRDLMRRSGMKPSPILRTIIDRELYHRPPNRSAVESDLEFE